ncbi:unnamed protein product [Pleuronectes platessa]|uniref:Uncharacterized protein n=1 Tax=Pleuronectes platessa TaxID=8262 RepID=A0A9N7UK13_PLEPL|nr:unnamed protein product [Pleuronectes platessa]
MVAGVAVRGVVRARHKERQRWKYRGEEWRRKRRRKMDYAGESCDLRLRCLHVQDERMRCELKSKHKRIRGRPNSSKTMRHGAVPSLMTHCPLHCTLDEAAGWSAGVNASRQLQRVSQGALARTRPGGQIQEYYDYITRPVSSKSVRTLPKRDATNEETKGRRTCTLRLRGLVTSSSSSRPVIQPRRLERALDRKQPAPVTHKPQHSHESSGPQDHHPSFYLSIPASIHLYTALYNPLCRSLHIPMSHSF